MMPYRPVLGVIVAALFWSVAAAADPSDSDRALATELFKEGRELMAAGNTHEACAKFAESQRLDPGGGTVLNLASCYEKEGRLASAWSAFNEGLSFARRDGRAEREALAQERLAALEPRLSRLVIEVPPESEIEGLVVLRDGSPVGRAAWGTGMPVDVGAHRIDVTAPGHVSWSTTVEVKADASRDVVSLPRLEAEPAPPPEPPPAPAPVVRARAPSRPIETDEAPSGDGQRLTGFVIGGAGVVGLGVGTYFGIRTLSKKSESDAECEKGCSDRGAELSSEAKTTADISTVSLLLGVIGVGAGGYLLLTAPSSPKPRVGVAIAPRGLVVHGAF